MSYSAASLLICRADARLRGGTRRLRRAAARSMKTLLHIMAEAGWKWLAHNAPRMAAAIAFYMILSLAPLVVLSGQIADLLLSGWIEPGHLEWQIQALLGQPSAELVTAALTGARPAHQSPLALVVGITVLVLSSAAVLGSLQSAMNTVWEIQVRPGHIWRAFAWRRLVALGMVLVLGVLLLVEVLLAEMLGYVHTHMQGLLPVPPEAWRAVQWAFTFVSLLCFFALVYKVLPDAHIPLRPVLLGALVTDVLLMGGRALLGLYFRYAYVASPYGAGATLVVFLLWVYYSGLIVLYGAEFTRALVLAGRGSIRPRSFTIWGNG